MSSIQEVDKLKNELYLLEKRIIHMKGNEKKRAVKEYHRLLHLCKKECQIDEPIYIARS